MGKSKQVNEVESLTIEGMEGLVAERNEARIEAEVNEMQETMRKPLGDVSQKAGDMERNAPLFFGTGDNPTLF